jgi:hypothetical protein
MATTTRSAYQLLLCRPEWKRKRHAILERDGWRCVECRSEATPGNDLQVDHKKYPQGGFPWEVPDHYLQTLCRRCHEVTTAQRRRITDLIAEMNIYELPLVVSMLEGFWGENQRPPQSKGVMTVPTLKSQRRLELIEIFEREKNALLEESFTPARSRRIEELDEMIDAAWGRVQSAAA